MDLVVMENKKQKIGIIVPYFGTWPEWIDYYLVSCKYNSNIDWLFFTDCGNPDVKASNLIYYKMSLNQLNKLIFKKLGITVNIINPYKICDFRPAFGKIFDDYLKSYDFWGYGDIDLIYGDFEKFITHDILQTFDVITTCKDFLCGHLCLYRNNETVNGLFKFGQEYLKVFQDYKHHYAFDERSRIIGMTLFHSNKKLWLKEMYYFIEHKIHKVIVKLLSLHKKYYFRDITLITDYASKQGIIKMFRKKIMISDEWFIRKNISNWAIEWKNGRLYDKYYNKEILYFHFIKTKNKNKFNITKWRSDNDFLINKDGISYLEE